MAATHATVAFLASTSSSTQSTGSWIDLTAAYSCLVSALVTNGGTGPTTGCTVKVQVSPDNGTTVYDFASATAGTANSTSYYFNFDLPPGTMYARVDFSSTSQSVTKQADGQKLTGL